MAANLDYEQAGELKFGQVGIANLRIRTLDPARLAAEMAERQAAEQKIEVLAFYDSLTAAITPLLANLTTDTEGLVKSSAERIASFDEASRTMDSIWVSLTSFADLQKDVAGTERQEANRLSIGTMIAGVVLAVIGGIALVMTLQRPIARITATMQRLAAAYPDLVLPDADAIAEFLRFNPAVTLVNGNTVRGIDRLDLWVGGLMEAHVNDGVVGGTFWVIIHEQLDRLQEADRFYYFDRVKDFDFYGAVKDSGFAGVLGRTTGWTYDDNVFITSPVPAGAPVPEEPVDAQGPVLLGTSVADELWLDPGQEVMLVFSEPIEWRGGVIELHRLSDDGEILGEESIAIELGEHLWVDEHTLTILLPLMFAVRMSDRNRRALEKDPTAEHRMHPLVNRVLRATMTVELALIRLGLRLPEPVEQTEDVEPLVLPGRGLERMTLQQALIALSTCVAPPGSPTANRKASSPSSP